MKRYANEVEIEMSRKLASNCKHYILGAMEWDILKYRWMAMLVICATHFQVMKRV